MKSNDINYTESYKGDYMSYHIPSDDELVNFVHENIRFDITPNTNDCFRSIVNSIDKAIKIASLNFKYNKEYFYYLKHFLRYIEASVNNDNSPLRRKFDDYLKLRKLNEIL